MNEKHINIIKLAYQLYNTRDLDNILLLMHPEITWPCGWEGDYIKGHEAIQNYWTSQWKDIDPIIKILSIDENRKGQLQVTVNQYAKNNEGEIRNVGIVKHVYVFENDLIKYMEITKP